MSIYFFMLRHVGQLLGNLAMQNEEAFEIEELMLELESKIELFNMTLIYIIILV